MSISCKSYIVVLLGRITCTQCMRCGLLLQISHLAWFVCLCVRRTGELCKNGGTDPRCCLRGCLKCIRWGCRFPMGRGIFEQDTSALRQPRATVPAQCTQRTNAFGRREGRHGNTAMRPLAKLLWTLVIILASIVDLYSI